MPVSEQSNWWNCVKKRNNFCVIRPFYGLFHAVDVSVSVVIRVIVVVYDVRKEKEKIRMTTVATINAKNLPTLFFP